MFRRLDDPASPLEYRFKRPYNQTVSGFPKSEMHIKKREEASVEIILACLAKKGKDDIPEKIETLYKYNIHKYTNNTNTSIQT
jgi:hypothetical protein